MWLLPLLLLLVLLPPLPMTLHTRVRLKTCIWLAAKSVRLQNESLTSASSTPRCSKGYNFANIGRAAAMVATRNAVAALAYVS
jgi:hypothetical protein